MKKTSESNGTNDAGDAPAMTDHALAGAATAGVQVPEGMTMGATFTERGRRYVVLDGRRLITNDDPPKPDDLKAVEIAEDIPVGEIVASPFNRKHFDETRLNEIADSLRKSGQMETAVVRLLPPGHAHGLMFELVAGERRWRGCKIAGIPVLRCHVRELSDSEAAEQLLLSNLEREDLTPIEEATTYQQLLELKDETGAALYSLERIAERVFGDERRKDRVARVLKLLNLPAAMRKALDAGETSVSVAFLVGRLANAKDREAAAKEILTPQYSREPLNFKQARELVEQKFQVNLKGAPFGLNDADLVEVKLDDRGARLAGGACQDCPWLARNNPAFEIAHGSHRPKGGGGTAGVDAMTCTNPACYESKLEVLWQRTAAEIQKKEPALQIVPRKKAEKWFSRYSDGLDWNAPIVLLDAKVNHNQGAPTWAKVLKGTDVPILLVCNRRGQAVKAADQTLAKMAALNARPELFKQQRGGDEEVTLSKTEMEKLKKESAATGTTLVALVEKARKAKAAEAERNEKLERKIESEARMDALREMQAAMTRKGVDLDALVIVWRKLVRESYMDELPLYLGIEEDENGPGADLEDYPVEKGLTTTQLLPLIVIASFIEDLNYSGFEKATEFKELAKLYGVDYKAVHARVKKAHELAEKDRLKAEAAKEAAENKRPHKNSSDPIDWTPEQETAKTAAADALAKEGGAKKRVAAKKAAAKAKAAKSKPVKKAKGKK